MDFIIIASKKDPAGMNIIEELKKINTKLKINIIDKELIFSDNIDKKLSINEKESFIVFASKHRAKELSKTLTVHTIGNFHKAEHGGIDNKIPKTNATVFKHFFKNINKINSESKSEYKVSLEATHHGPYLETPSLFIELGSSEEEWNDKSGAKIIAEAISESISSFKSNTKVKSAIAIGGPHYCPNFNKIQLEDEFAINFIASKYSLPLNKDNIKEMISSSYPKPGYIILDWKGLGNAELKIPLLELLKDFNLEIIKV